MRRAVMYLRVSTLDQTTANQERELREIAGRMGCDVVKVYKDHGISGTRGRDKRPAFDALCRAAARREFDLVMAWSVDRLGRSLQDLVGFLSELHALKIDLFLRQQGLDTTTPAGKAMFQMMACLPSSSKCGDGIAGRRRTACTREASRLIRCGDLRFSAKYEAPMHTIKRALSNRMIRSAQIARDGRWPASRPRDSRVRCSARDRCHSDDV